MFFDLLKRIFALWAENRKLNRLNKAIDEYNKAKEIASRKLYVMAALIEEYETEYSENLYDAKEGVKNG